MTRSYSSGIASILFDNIFNHFSLMSLIPSQAILLQRSGAHQSRVGAVSTEIYANDFRQSITCITPKEQPRVCPTPLSLTHTHLGIIWALEFLGRQHHPFRDANFSTTLTEKATRVPLIAIVFTSLVLTLPVWKPYCLPFQQKRPLISSILDSYALNYQLLTIFGRNQKKSHHWFEQLLVNCCFPQSQWKRIFAQEKS